MTDEEKTILLNLTRRLAGIEEATLKSQNGDRELLVRIDERVGQMREVDIPQIHTRLDTLNNFKSKVEKQVTRNTATIAILLAMTIAVGTAAVTNFAGVW